MVLLEQENTSHLVRKNVIKEEKDNIYIKKKYVNPLKKYNHLRRMAYVPLTDSQL